MAASGRFFFLATKLSMVFGSSSKMSRGSQVFGPSSKMATCCQVFGSYPIARKMSTGLGSQVSKMAEELLQAIKEPPSEGSTEKLVKMAENLLKAIKAPPTAEIPAMNTWMNEVSRLNIKIDHLQGTLSEVRASSKLTATVTFTIFSVFGCLILAFPNAVNEIKLISNNNEKKCREGEEKTEKKYQKLKDRVSSLEVDNKERKAAVPPPSPAAVPPPSPAAHEEKPACNGEVKPVNWVNWLSGLLRKG